MKSLLISSMLVIATGSSATAYTLVDPGANAKTPAINNTGVSNTDLNPVSAFRWSPASSLEFTDNNSANAVNNTGQSPAMAIPCTLPNLLPQAIASADDYAGKAPLRVSFDSSGSTDADGTIIAYDWDFMDGNTSTEPNPSHRFTDAGAYAVTLTVTDDQGTSASNTITITVMKANNRKK